MIEHGGSRPEQPGYASGEIPDRLFQEIAHLTADALILLDEGHRILLFNPAAEALFGYREAEVLGQPLEILIPSRYHERHDELVWGFRSSSDQTHRMGGRDPVMSRKQDGSESLVDVTITKHEAGGRRYFSAVVRDRSEKEKAEEAIRAGEALYRSIITAMAEGIVLQDSDGRILACNRSAERILGLTSDQIMGRTSLDPRWQAVHEDGSPFPGDEHPAAVTLRTGQALTNVIMGVHHPDGALVWISINSQALIRPGEARPYAVVTSFADITERVRSREELLQREEQLELRVGERTRELAALLDLSHNLASTLDLHSVTALILEGMRAFVEYDEASLWVAEGDELRSVGRRPEGHVPPGQEPRLSSQALLAVCQPGGPSQPAILEDVSGVSSAIQAMLTASTEGGSAAAQPPRSGILVPLMLKGALVGCLTLLHHRPGVFGAGQLRLLQALADQAAVAVENSRRYSQIQVTAAQAERSRLSRDLHDSVTQMLYSLTLFAEAGRQQMDQGGHDKTAQHLEQIRETAQQALREMRLMVYELRPSVLKEIGLVEALRRRVEAVERRAGVEAEVAAEAADRIPVSLEEDLFRIALEALNNSLKHSSSTRVTIRLKGQPEGVRLEVADNGKGMNSTKAYEEGGWGLTSMRERAGRLGGEVTIHSISGEGTTILAWVPLPDPAGPEVKTDG